jgi:hypothetical protein
VSLALGDWKVRADAFLEDNTLFGSGTADDVHIQGGRTNSVTITMTSFYLTDLGDVAAYLDEAPGGSSINNPVTLKVMLGPSNTWDDLLGKIRDAGKYVVLDLSPCTGSGNSGGGLYSDGTFDPDSSNTNAGKGKIVSLVLPNAATKIADDSTSTFQHFTVLKSVEGKAVATVGDRAFYERTSLVSVSLPEATVIGGNAFGGTATYNGCTSLVSVNLPKATKIGANAFGGCTSLTSVSLPEATVIDPLAFGGCNGLTSVILPKATVIGQFAFAYCTALSTITLGAAPPELRTELFSNITGPQSVTVKVPNNTDWSGIISGSPYNEPSASFTDNWGNGFRGGGWNGTGMTNSNYVNPNITLNIEPLP